MNPQLAKLRPRPLPPVSMKEQRQLSSSPVKMNAQLAKLRSRSLPPVNTGSSDNEYYWWLFGGLSTCSKDTKKSFDLFLKGHLQALNTITMKAIEDFQTFIAANQFNETFIRRCVYLLITNYNMVEDGIAEPVDWYAAWTTAAPDVAAVAAKAVEEINKILWVHLHKIFNDRTVSLTSLNIKAYQCAILCTIIEYLNGNSFMDGVFLRYDYEQFDRFIKDGTYNEVVEQYSDERSLMDSDDDTSIYSGDPTDLTKPIVWDTFESMKEYINSGFYTIINPGIILKDLIIEEEEGCVPNLKGKAIICLNGELTLYQLIRSLVDNYYLLGFSPVTVKADGTNMSPSKFIEHDEDHKRLIESFGLDDRIRGYLKMFLDSQTFKSLTPNDKHACEVWLFFILHEVIHRPPHNSKVLQIPYFLSEGEISRNPDFKNIYIDKFLSLLPAGMVPPIYDVYDMKEKTEAELKNYDDARKNFDDKSNEWLQESWIIFKDTWNSVIGRRSPRTKSFLSSPTIQDPRKMTKKKINNLKKKLKNNVALWNRVENSADKWNLGLGGYRRTKKRRSKKRSNKTHKTHKIHKTHKTHKTHKIRK